jgi:hypothetical protein
LYFFLSSYHLVQAVSVSETSTKVYWTTRHVILHVYEYFTRLHRVTSSHTSFLIRSPRSYDLKRSQVILKCEYKVYGVTAQKRAIIRGTAVRISTLEYLSSAQRFNLLSSSLNKTKRNDPNEISHTTNFV